MKIQMATIGCKAPSTGTCSFISLQRQQHFACHVECRVKSGCESLKHETSDALSEQSGLPCAKASNIIVRRQGSDDIQTIPMPFSENFEKGSSSLFESSANVDKYLISLQTCLLTLPISSSSQNNNLQSISISEINKVTTFDFLTNIVEDISLNDCSQHKDLKHHESKVIETDSVAYSEHQGSVGETDICLNALDINNRPSASIEAIHSNGGSEATLQSQPIVLQSFLSPLRSLKRWIVNSLRRAFMSLNYKKPFNHDSDDVLIGNNRTETCEGSSHLQRSIDETEHAMPIDEENDSMEFPWELLKKFLESPYFVKFRVSISMANLTMTVSTFLSKALPVLSEFKKRSVLRELSLSIAPTYFGGRIVLDTAISNLTFVISQLMMNLAIVWVLWSLKHVTRTMIGILQKYGAVEKPVFNILLLWVEVAFGATATLAILSSIAASNPSLAVPSFVALALAGKDVLQNYFAGFFLLATKPIQPGYIVSVPCYSTGSEPSAAISSLDCECKSGWTRGVCESVGLTYTVLRNAHSQVRIPNSMFIRREFLVVDTSQAHVNAHGSSMSLKNLKLLENSKEYNMKQPNHAPIRKDLGGSFETGKSNLTCIGQKVGKPNLTSIGNKRHQLIAKASTSCTSL